MKRQSFSSIEQMKFNRVKTELNNLESYKMVTDDLNPEIIEFIKEKNDERKELNLAANYVRNYVTYLKKEMTNDICDKEIIPLQDNELKSKSLESENNNIKKNESNNLKRFSAFRRNIEENKQINEDYIKKNSSYVINNRYKFSIHYDDSNFDKKNINEIKKLQSFQKQNHNYLNLDDNYNHLISLKNSFKNNIRNYNNEKNNFSFIHPSKSLLPSKKFFHKNELNKCSKSSKSIQRIKFNHSLKRINKELENDSSNKSILSNNNILMLNDIKKELKSSFIGDKILNIKKKKVYFLDDITNFPLEPINSIKEETDTHQLETRYRNLQKKGYVYDSFDDEEILEEQINLFYINPDSKYILFFDLLIALCAVFNIIYIPLFFGYNKIYCNNNFFNLGSIIELFIDILYIIDLILPFFTAFYNFDENLNTGLNHIAKKYLSEWFILDLLQAIPFKTILDISDKKCKNSSFQLHPNYNNNFYYILYALRLFKIIKVVKNNKFIEKITNILNETNHYNNYLKIYKNLFIFIICIHTVSNIFIFIGRNEYPNWIIYYGYDSYSYLKLYLTAIYYTIETLTTVGYGDLTCITPNEKLFGLFMEIVGIFAYSWAISRVSNYFKIINEKNENYERNYQILNQIKLFNPKFPIDLYDRILRYLKYKHDHEKVDKKILFDSLSPNLSNLLCYEMYKPIIQNFIFFKDFDNIDFIVKVVLNFNPILAVKNDILIKDGELVEDIIFVKKGRLSLELPLEFNPKFNQKNTSIINSIMPHCPKTFGETIISQNKQDYFQMFSRTKSKINIKKSLPKKNEDIQVYKILEIRKNEHFGDILMFLNLRSPLILRTKTQKAELFLLHKTAAIEISTSYPLIWKKINQKSLFNYEQIRRLMNKIIKIFQNNHGLIYNKQSFNEDEDLYSLISYQNESNGELKSIPSFTDSNYDIDSVHSELKKKRSIMKKGLTLSPLNKKNNNQKNLNNSDIYKDNNNYDKKKFYGSSEEDSNCEKDIIYEEKDDEEGNDFNSSRNSDDDSDSKSYDKNKKQLTPFREDEINQEIYPNEVIYDEKHYKKIKNEINNIQYDFKLDFLTENNNYLTRTKEKNYLIKTKEKNFSNYSISSTEISFSLHSEYENLNELSDYKYSKDLKLREKIRNILEKKEKKNEKKEEDEEKENYILLFSKKSSSEEDTKPKIRNKRRSISYFEPKHKKINEFVKKIDSNRLQRKKFKKYTQNVILNSQTTNFNQPKLNTQKKKKQKNLLTTINKNIERNQINLNNPELFYSEYFQEILDKKKEKKGDNNSFNKEMEAFRNKLQSKKTLSKINSSKNIKVKFNNIISE